MQFNSLDFIVFFPVVTLIYFLIPKKVKNIWLLFASYYFYMCWNVKYISLLLTSTVITYLSGLLLEKFKHTDKSDSRKIILKKCVVAVSIILNIGMLFYFKYTNFALDTIQNVLSKFNIIVSLPDFDIILPIGISFYIFQALSYTIDVYRDEIYAEKNFFRYALFVSFFPQLVAGPIERSKNLLKQFSQPKTFDYPSVRSGLLTMLWGYFVKMVIADRCAILVDTVYADYPSYFGFQLITANVFFAIQIYCDFMGYSTIAKGAAKVLGYNLMDNFNSPYLATSVKDFWRRWHISLSSWLKDYLYIPLGGNKKGKFRKYLNIMITFLISGLWHGANLTFVLWGIIHGIYQIAEDIVSPLYNKFIQTAKINTETFSYKFLQILKTFVLVDLAWVFFRAGSIPEAFCIIKQSFYLKNFWLILNDGLYQLGLDVRNMNILTLGIAALLISDIMRGKNIVLHDWIKKQNIIFRYALYWGALMLIIFSMDITGKEFIYFQF